MSMISSGKYFSLESFLKGIAGVCVIYLLLAGYVVLRTGHTLRTLGSKLSFEVVSLASPDGAREELLPEAPPKVMENGLTLAPIEGLYERSEKTGGMLPKISPRGLTPFHGYKKPFEPNGKPVLALAVRGFGLSASLSEKLLEQMPEDVTFILSPYAADVQEWQQKARNAGHETWMNVPAETKEATTSDPGSQALLSHSNIQYNKDRMNWALSLTTGYAGIAMDMDNTFLEVMPMLSSLMEETLQRGLGYFEMNTKGPDVIETISVNADAPYLKNNILVKNNIFSSLESAARSRGALTAVIDLDTLKEDDFMAWVSSLEKKGFQLAPLSALALGR